MRKTMMILLSLALVSWGAFAQHDHSKMNKSNDGHSKMDSEMNSKSTIQSTIQVEHSQSVTAIIDNYLALEDALAEDNSNKAAGSGKMLFDAFANFDFKNQPIQQQKELAEIIEDASENAEHISENGGNIEHQREHFEMLSTDIRDLVTISGSDRTLYQLFCPMYNNNVGGMWLSASREVKNPFYGSKMLKCGSVQQEITVK